MTDEEKLTHYEQLAELDRLKSVQTVIAALEERLREAAPEWCCDHDEPPCLACALEWLVESLGAGPRVGAAPVFEADPVAEFVR